MKLTKSLFMLCAAGLSLCACNSDDKLQVSDGYGDVIIKILPPETNTRTVTGGQTGDDDDKVQIQGSYKVSLTAAAITSASEDNFTYNNQDGTVTFTQEVYAGDKTSHQVTFSGVKNPIKVAVSLNDGIADYKEVGIASLNGDGESKIPTKAPAYGESTDFTSKETVDNLTTYNVTIKMAIPIARLEIGNITYTDAANSLFSKLEVGGIYLDKLSNYGSKYSAGDFISQATQFVDYQFSTSTGTGAVSILKDNAPSPALDFIANPTGSLPGNSNVYAYNFYGATTESDEHFSNPYFKIYFSNTQLKSESTPIARYAMITRYTDGANPIKLENGKIYRITNIALADENILLDEENNSIYNVEVTVQEARWTIADINGAWAN
jgi:hypothetical protein